MGPILVMLLGQLKGFLKLIDLCVELQLEHPQLRLPQLILEIISITPRFLYKWMSIRESLA